MIGWYGIVLYTVEKTKEQKGTVKCVIVNRRTCRSLLDSQYNHELEFEVSPVSRLKTKQKRVDLHGIYFFIKRQNGSLVQSKSICW